MAILLLQLTIAHFTEIQEYYGTNGNILMLSHVAEKLGAHDYTSFLP